MKLGKILGFQIALDPSWFIVFALVLLMLLHGGFPHLFTTDAPAPGLGLAVVAALLLFASVLAHELGHSVIGRRMGVEIEGITLFIFGGIARLKEEPRRPSVEFWMTVAGPAVSALLGAAFFGLALLGFHHGWPAALVAVFGYLSIANQTIAVFNLIPAFPLDGGRILRSVLWAMKKDVVAATRWASNVSRFVAFGLIALGAIHIVTGSLAGMWEIFIGLFVLTAATTAYQQVYLRHQLEGVSVASLLNTDSRPVPARMTLNWVVDDFVFGSDQRAFPVMDGEDLRGILTLEDIRNVPVPQWPWTMAIEIAQPVVEEDSIEDGEDAWHALSQMLSANAWRLLVVHNGRIRGVVTRDQVLDLLNLRPTRT